MLALALACVAAAVSARAVVEVDAKGGYGNQLFEFASCRALALRAGAAFRADTQAPRHRRDVVPVTVTAR